VRAAEIKKEKKKGKNVAARYGILEPDLDPRKNS
jgi:hypothetical protein